MVWFVLQYFWVCVPALFLVIVLYCGCCAVFWVMVFNSLSKGRMSWRDAFVRGTVPCVRRLGLSLDSWLWFCVMFLPSAPHHDGYSWQCDWSSFESSIFSHRPALYGKTIIEGFVGLSVPGSLVWSRFGQWWIGSLHHVASHGVHFHNCRQPHNDLIFMLVNRKKRFSIKLSSAGERVHH